MYSDRFIRAFKYLIDHEGGYSNNPTDPGGETKYGISKRSYPQYVIKDLTLDDAKRIYHTDYWSGERFDEIENEDVAIKIFDIAVNAGKSQAIKIVQRALRAVGYKPKIDGILGIETLSCINNVKDRALLVAIRSEAAGYYTLLAEKNKILNVFLSGWLNRAYS
jgi:lysozyme family protein